MTDIRWLANRLRAMSAGEIAWRVQQKLLSLAEERRFRTKCAVTERIFYPARTGLASGGAPDADFGRLFLHAENPVYTLHTAIALPSPYSYEDYKTRWHAGFQTDNDWPIVPSARLDYRGMDAVGDARTNWELNKHFQFALLAKDYAASGDRRYLDELAALFRDWNEKNPFLWGISWTSAIEVAERTMNWCYAAAFLAAADDVPAALLGELRIGIVNMADWLFHHYSRYSSANNHLIVEISAVLHAGIVTGNDRWITKAVEILSRELFLQNCADGVNREEALYYQAFMMEACALDLRLLEKNGLAAQETARWRPLLTQMSRYVASCIGPRGEVVEFGDNDGGKLLDLAGCGDGEAGDGEGIAYYRYLLQFMGLLLPERYAAMEADALHENLRWLFTAEEISRAAEKPLFVRTESVDYAEGGNAVLRSADGEVLIGIDHAPLGYGALCAHGHADALSFQAFVGGEPFLCDPGTYIYHMDIAARNAFRATASHNTVCVGGRDQSEMRGAFLWGKRANCTLLQSSLTDARDVIEAEQDGYAPYIHWRSFDFDREDKVLRIADTVGGAQDAVFSLLFAAGCAVTETAPGVFACTSGRTGRPLGTVTLLRGFAGARIVPREISETFGKKEETVGLAARIVSEPALCAVRFGAGEAGGPHGKSAGEE